MAEQSTTDTAERPALTFSDIGIQVPKITTDSILGKVRTLNSLTKKEVVFLVLTLVCLLVSLGVTIHSLAIVDQRTADFTFALVLLVNICNILSFYVIHGVFFERPYELSVLVLAVGGVWLYLVLNYAISRRGVSKLVRLIFSSVLTPFVIVMGVHFAKGYHTSKSLIFRTIGANTALQDACTNMFIFYGILNGDLQISLSMAILIMTSGERLDLEDKILLPVGLVLAILFYLCGYIGVRRENKLLVICHSLLWLYMPAYAMYLIIESAKDMYTPVDNTQVKDGILAITFVAAGASLVVRAMVGYFAVKTFFNFGKGIRYKVYGDGPNPDPSRPMDVHDTGVGSIQDRV